MASAIEKQDVKDIIAKYQDDTGYVYSREFKYIMDGWHDDTYNARYYQWLYDISRTQKTGMFSSKDVKLIDELEAVGNIKIAIVSVICGDEVRFQIKLWDEFIADSMSKKIYDLVGEKLHYNLDDHPNILPIKYNLYRKYEGYFEIVSERAKNNVDLISI